MKKTTPAIAFWTFVAIAGVQTASFASNNVPFEELEANHHTRLNSSTAAVALDQIPVADLLAEIKRRTTVDLIDLVGKFVPVNYLPEISNRLNNRQISFEEHEADKAKAIKIVHSLKESLDTWGEKLGDRKVLRPIISQKIAELDKCNNYLNNKYPHSEDTVWIHLGIVGEYQKLEPGYDKFLNHLTYGIY